MRNNCAIKQCREPLLVTGLAKSYDRRSDLKTVVRTGRFFCPSCWAMGKKAASWAFPLGMFVGGVLFAIARKLL